MSNLKASDPELYELCLEEKNRQRKEIELIASENFPTASVLECLSSSFHNKYSEGYPGARYYGGTKIIDKLELLCYQRALKCFDLDPDIWGVNVQALSGSPANFAVYTALAGPHGRIMGLDLSDGGHLTHGFVAPSGKKVSATSVFFESMPYKLDPTTCLIDFKSLSQNAKIFHPKIIIAGTSSYCRFLDYAKFREICDDVGSILMADMAHISGLVAAKLHPSPFDYCDVVTTTTHKTLRGPRSGLIFYRKIKYGHSLDKSNNNNNKTVKTNFERLINEAVFPGLNGGPHNHTIAAVAAALNEAMKPEYRIYQQQVVKNMQTLINTLTKGGLTFVTNGSDVHLSVVDLRSIDLDGPKLELTLQKIGIIVNKNTVPGDKSALKPSGIRIGTPAMTSRDMKEPEMEKIGTWILRGVHIAKLASSRVSGNTHEEFSRILDYDQEIKTLIDEIKNMVESFVDKYPLPGLDY